jgi:hypothetical protein
MSRFLATLLALIFIFTTPPVLLAFNLAQLATNREAFKQALRQTDLRQVAIDAAAATLTQLANQQGIGVEGINPALINSTLEAAIPPQWIEEQSNRVVDALFDYLETGDPARLTLTIDTAPLFDRFRSEIGAQAIVTAVESFPPCPPGQLPIDPSNLAVTTCLPEGVNVATAAAIIHSNLTTLLDNNPQLIAEANQIEVNVLEISGTNPALLQQLQQLRQTLQRLQTGSWLLWLIPMGCLFFILLLVVRSPGSFGSWWGWPMFAAALLTLLLTFLAPTILTSSLLLLPALPPEADSLLRSLLTTFIAIITQLWFFRVRIQAAFMLAASLPLIVIGLTWWLLYPRQNDAGYDYDDGEYEYDDELT